MCGSVKFVYAALTHTDGVTYANSWSGLIDQSEVAGKCYALLWLNVRQFEPTVYNFNLPIYLIEEINVNNNK